MAYDKPTNKENCVNRSDNKEETQIDTQSMGYDGNINKEKKH